VLPKGQAKRQVMALVARVTTAVTIQPGTHHTPFLKNSQSLDVGGAAMAGSEQLSINPRNLSRQTGQPRRRGVPRHRAPAAEVYILWQDPVKIHV